MNVYFAPEAEADFAAVVGYLIERNPVAASEFSDRIFNVIERLIACCTRSMVRVMFTPGSCDQRSSPNGTLHVGAS